PTDADPNTEEEDSIATESIPLTVLSTSTSPIATQLHIKSGTGPTWDQVRAVGSTVKGMLTLELTADQTVQIPVSVKHEDVQRCLHRLTPAVKYETSNASKSTVSDCTSNTELSTVKKLQQNSSVMEPHLSQPPEPHTCTSIEVAAGSKFKKPHICHPKLTPSSLTTSSSVINTRTHEELQAACTILSLANCGELPPPLLCPVSPPTLANCRPEPLSKTGLTSSILEGSQVPLEPRESRRDRSPPTIDPVPLMTEQDSILPNIIPSGSHGMMTTELDPIHGEGSNRSRSAFRHTQHLKSNTVSRTLDSIEPSATQKHRTERVVPLMSGIVPNQPKIQPSIRPPPKKRLCEEYERSLAVPPADIHVPELRKTATSLDSISVSAIEASPSTTTISSADVGLFHGSKLTVNDADASIAALNIPKPAISSAQPTVEQNSTTNPLPTGLTSNPVAIVPDTIPTTTVTMVFNPTLTSPVQYTPLSSAQNVFILPQLMLLPRIISPYIPNSPNPGVVTSCYIVQPDGAMIRANAVPPIMTNAMPTPIPPAVRNVITAPSTTTKPQGMITQPAKSAQPIPVVPISKTVMPTSEINGIAVLEEMQRKGARPSAPLIRDQLLMDHSSQVSTPLFQPSVSTSVNLSRPNAPSGPTVSKAIGTLIAAENPLQPSSVTTGHNTKRVDLVPARLVSILPATNATPPIPIPSTGANPTVIATTTTATTTSAVAMTVPNATRSGRSSDGRAASVGRISGPRNEPQRLVSSALVTSRLMVSRNRYRCYECGLVCHKPCLLRKHYRTHSNVRPYMCQHCDVSFKTRGNLSKHMKSRGHHDRCVRELGLVHAPLVVDDETQVDRQALERQRQLVSKKDHLKRSEIWRSRFRAIRANASATSINRVSQAYTITRAAATSAFDSDMTVNRMNGKNADTKSGPIPTESNSRIPAPNVNAVHLLQDLPLNLSVRPRQPTTLVQYTADAAKRGTSCIDTEPNEPCVVKDWSTCARSKSPVPDTEAMIRSAVAAARTMSHEQIAVNSNGAFSEPIRTSVEQVGGQPDGRSTFFPENNTHQPSVSFPAQSTTEPEKTYVSSSQSASCASAAENFPTNGVHMADHRVSFPVESPSVGRKPNSPSHPSSSNRVALAVMNQRNTPLTNVPLRPRSTSDCALVPGHEAIDTTGEDAASNDITQRSRLRDPRPYKCNVCQIGFRVTGHLHKHYRAKSHLFQVLQSHNLPSDTIECVRHSRISISQVVNPDSGQLRVRAIERILAIAQPSQTGSRASTEYTTLAKSN
ncbi:hypothetical protein EG68_04751, partial [Paragonimus skrjabini miyazakii]